MGKLKYLIIHCSATPEGMDVKPQQVKHWHTDPKPYGRGWDRVGYSDLVLLDGTIHNFVEYNEDDLVQMSELTYGVAGFNSVSRHICYIGGCDSKMNPKDTRTDKQKEALKQYVLNFKKKHPNAQVFGHYHFSPKACPSFNVEKWLKEIEL